MDLGWSTQQFPDDVLKNWGAENLYPLSYLLPWYPFHLGDTGQLAWKPQEFVP